MDKEVYIFEVSESSFNTSVLLNSSKLPVVVIFMNVWSEPCAILADTFSRLAREFAGQFIFAKVDIDEQPALREQYNIENVPTLLVFKDAQQVRTELGQLNEDEARALLKDYGVYNESDEMRIQAREKHLSGDTPGAVMLLTEAIKKDPANTRVAMDMVQIFIDVNQVEDAKQLFARLPEAEQNSEMGKSISGQLLFKELAANTRGITTLNRELQQNPDNHDIRFDLAICQVADYQYRDAMDNLFKILESDADYKEGAAREMIITLNNMLMPAEPALAQEYRRKLANTLAE
ncbi:MAG: tetratricopeptide repeat protein [Thioalkalispiraceae bacterium]|jgi:putative thioredoxin